MAPLIFPSILFTTGRACAGPLAVVLHQYSSGIEMLDSEMDRCPRPKPAQSPGCHTSFHYGVDGCTIHQYVSPANTAWGFGVTPPTCPEPICPPDPCESCTGVTADQYQPDLDGNPPVLPGWAAGPDGTVNCAVLHVAVAGGALVGADGCCRFLSDPQAYSCFVRSLAQIFVLNSLTPSQTTLLVHCGELPCIDIDQLVIDVLAYIALPPSVLPPCTCQPTGAQFVAGIEDLAVGDTFISGDSLVGADGELHEVFTDYRVDSVTSTTVINPNTYDTDVIFLTGGNLTIGTPTVAAALRELIIKNTDPAVARTVTGHIDGVPGAVITLDFRGGGPYPFGNAGGEAVHLIWDPDATTWQVV